MALVSPGVSVSVTDRSFYVSNQAPTVPLIFGATRFGKLQPNGVSLADGTTEHSVVRTITSIGQSVELYGIPYFWEDSSGAQHHGDARNEYGLFALNQYLGVGNRAYFVRANIDLTDAPETFISASVPQIQADTGIRVGNGTLTSASIPSALKKPETFIIRCIGIQVGETVNSFQVECSLSGVVGIARAGTAFVHPAINFTITEGTTVFAVGDYFEFETAYVPTTFIGTGNGVMTGLVPGSGATGPQNFTITFLTPTTFEVIGVHPVSSAVMTVTTTGTVGVDFADLSDNINFTIIQGSTNFVAGDVFTVEFTQVQAFNQLGVTDANKRQAIVQALQAEILMNQDVRSETYEYNLIVCPGYYEVVDEMLRLAEDISNEAFVISDTAVFRSPEQTATWAASVPSPSNPQPKVSNPGCAYYYAWGLASNLDGKDVVIAPSGIALRVYALSDKQSQVWFAPAGVRRGLVTGVTSCGYVTGTLGQPTKYIEASLNQGQRDALYEFGRAINPITFFAGRGLMIFGQKTSYGAASARDRVNVERLLCYLRRVLRKGAFPFIFEINDQITRDDLKAAFDGLLSDVMTLRGLYDYVTVCDESNNTAFRIDNNELYIDVGIKPAKVAEFVIIPITVFSTGAKMGTN